MLELTELAPADKLPPEQLRENAVLWQTESDRLGAAPDPGTDDAQEIAVNPGSDGELRLVFNSKDPDLVKRMAGVCNSMYVTDGASGIRDLLKGITETGSRAEAGFPVPAPARETPPVKGEQVYSGPDGSPKREALRAAVARWQESFDSFSRAAAARIQVVALELAQKKLEQSADRALRESLRYLQAGHLDRADTGRVAGLDAGLTGPDVADLADAITQIATLRRELALFQQEAAAAETELIRVGPSNAPKGVLGPSLRRAAQEADLRSLLDVPAAAIALAKASKGTEAAAQLLAQQCAGLSRVHPVLHRLWDQPVVLEIADLWNGTPAAERMGELMRSRSLADALAEIFNGVSAAANDFLRDLRINPEEIWRYRPAVTAALESVHLNPGDLAWRAAEDRLESAPSDLAPISSVSMGLNLVEMLSGLSAVAPPVGVALAVLSAGAMAGELIEAGLGEARKDRAFAACLDPADSLASEGGSYSGLVISAFFLVLQIRGIAKRPLGIGATR